MKNCLLLLTKTFPFGKGEEFIEAELPVLAREFEKIIVIATSTHAQDVQTRALPRQAVAHRLDAQQLQRRMPARALRLLLSKDFDGFAAQEDLQAIKGNLKRRAFLAYFTAKSELVAEACAAVVQQAALAQYDGVSYYAYWFYDVAVAAVQLRKRCPAPRSLAVSRAHRYDLYPAYSVTGFLPLRPYLLQNLDAVFPCSQDGTNCIAKNWPGHTEKLRTAYLGTKDYGRGPAPTGEQLHLVSCCHISAVKRVELLAQALALLAQEGLPLRWTHFGGGDGWDQLRAFAADHLHGVQVTFAGEVPNQAVLDFYQKTPVDLFVNTSSSEGLPVSIMEAASFGIPAIATDVGGTREIVQPGRTGWLLPADLDAQQLAACIRSAAALGAAGRAPLRSACRQLWEEKFCGEKNFLRFAQCIQPTAQGESI